MVTGAVDDEGDGTAVLVRDISGGNEVDEADDDNDVNDDEGD